MKEFYKNQFATVFYEDNLDALFLQYTNRVPNDEQFIIANQAVLKAFTELNTSRFVADIRKMGIISLNAQDWVLKNLIPGMIRHLKGKTLFHAQLLDASEIMSKVSASNIKNKSSQMTQGMEIMQFTNEEEMNQHLKTIKS
jgi:hypothetical protein